MTLDVIAINGLTKNYAVLIESLLTRVRKMGIQAGTLFLDREFFHTVPISTAYQFNTKFVMAAKSNQKINAILDEHKEKFGYTSTIFEYQFGKGGPTFSIVAVVNPKYDPMKKKGKGNNEYHLFATNLKIISISEFIKIVPEEYRRRWNIETGYRVKNTFKIRTCSKSPVVRTLYFILQCILFNVLNLLKSGLNITAYELKSATNSDIIQCIKYGYESLQAIPVKIFVKILAKYNKIRIEVLRSRLSKIHL